MAFWYCDKPSYISLLRPRRRATSGRDRSRMTPRHTPGVRQEDTASSFSSTRSANREAQHFNLILRGGANRARYGMGETGGGAAEACLLSQWPVWAVVAFRLQPVDEAVRIGQTAIGQLARDVVVRSFFTSRVPYKTLLRLRIFASS